MYIPSFQIAVHVSEFYYNRMSLNLASTKKVPKAWQCYQH